MGARLMVVRGVIQRDDQQPDCPQQSGTGHDIIHVIARKLEDGTPMLRHLSDDLMPAPLSPGDGGGARSSLSRPPPGRHPREVSIIPKSRDFH
jgi:error-prone DNA polymerase